MLGPGRSLLGAYNTFHAKSLEKSGKVWKNALDASKSWKDAAQKWKWQERANSWDSCQQQIAEREYEDKWRKRREQIRESDFQDGQAQREKARMMISMPPVRQEISGGKTIFEAANASYFRTGSRLMSEASRLQRLACGMDDENETTVSIKNRGRSPLSGSVGGATVIVLPSNGRGDRESADENVDSHE